MNSSRNRIGVVLCGVVVIALTITSPLAAQSFGGGISVFVPWDMFEGDTGSISFETSMETSLGLGGMLSLPIGFSYNQVYGMSPTGTMKDGTADAGEALASGGPWFYGDSILPYAMLKLHIPVGPVYFDFFGGGALNYNFSVRPLEGQIARDLDDAGILGSGTGAVAISDVTVEDSLGGGWVAGAGVGVTFGQISVGVDVTYRNIIHDLSLSGSYVRENQAEAEFDVEDSVSELRFVLQGLSIGIGGSYEM